MFKSKIIYIPFLSIIFLLIACSEDSEENDTVSPTLSCPEAMNVSVDTFSNGAVVTFTSPVGTDNIAGSVTTQTGGLASGKVFPIGTTTNTFTTRDAAGNTSTCSFNVIVTRKAPSEDLPYFVIENPTPVGKKWAKIENLSDEFNQTDGIDRTKWYTKPDIASAGWFWTGRPPGLFIEESITVADGKLKIEANKLPATKIINGKSYDYSGGIVRSINQCKVGYYYESKMKANKTFMSSTFWMMTEENACPKRLELDIQECVGELTPGADAWAVSGKFDQIFHSNAFHRTSCANTVETRKQGSVITDVKNWSEYMVYGFWWKSETELWFYLNGKLAYKITNPTTTFDLPMYYNLAVETYDWNPPHADGKGMEKFTKEERSTQYEWIRTWKLDDK
ncbi:HYR domain-containing protein [Formosa agariphila]|nr:HYR domain-containing protein [Formosa agariphila]